DSRSTLAGLVRAVETLPGRPSVTVAYASVPPWACGMTAALGYPVMVGQPQRYEFPWPLSGGMRGVCLEATPPWGIRSVVAEPRRARAARLHAVHVHLRAADQVVHGRRGDVHPQPARLLRSQAVGAGHREREAGAQRQVAGGVLVEERGAERHPQPADPGRA